jgi:putative hydrolase of the HAD superfamily
MTSKPDIVALDLDDTMYAYQPCHQAAMSLVSRELANRFELPENRWLPVYEESRIETKMRLGAVASSHSRLIYFKGMLERLNMKSHIDLAFQLENLYWGEFIRQIKKAQGLDRFLEIAREKGIPVVVVTDLTTGIQIRKLHHLGITDMVAALVTSEDVGTDKPNIGFLDYATKLGLGGGHWWVVGDDLEKDGGLAKMLPSADFLHVSAGSPSETSFSQLSDFILKALH